MDLKKKDKKTPYLTPKGKAVSLVTLISGGLSYLIYSLMIFGKQSEEMKSFLELNFYIFLIIFSWYLSFIIAGIVTGDMDDLINKK